MLYFQSEKKCIINIALLKFSVLIGIWTDLSIQKDTEVKITELQNDQIWNKQIDICM